MHNLLILIISLFSLTVLANESVVVYSARNEQLIKPLFDAYTRETGVNIKFTTDKEGPLMTKLKAEGASTPADLFITVDAGNLWQASQEQLLAPVTSAVLEKNIPAHLRSTTNEWFGLSVRARTIVYNPTKVKAESLSTYEALADAKWKGKLCLRSSQKVYNQSLVAMLIAEHGEEKTEKIVQGWVNNLATAPLSDDTQALEAVASGLCDVTIVNTYYFGRLMDKSPNSPLAIFWPNQGKNEKGVHINISGAGVTKHAKNPAGAKALLEWLSSEKAQNLYADSNMEYPANPAVKPSAAVAAWGTFKSSDLNVAQAGQLQKQAVMLMDRAKYK